MPDTTDGREELVDYRAKWEAAEAENLQLREAAAKAKKERDEAVAGQAPMKQALQDSWADRDRYRRRADEAMEAHKNLKLQFDAMKLQLDKLGQRNHELENHSSMTGAYVVDQENASLRDQLAELTKRYGELESSHRVLTLARDENSTKISQLRDRVFELEAEGKRLRKLSGEHWDALERLSSMSMEMMRFAERRLGRYGDVAGPSGGHG